MARMMQTATAPRLRIGDHAIHPLGHHEVEIVSLLHVREEFDLFAAFVEPYWRASIIHVDAAGWRIGYFEEIRLDELAPVPEPALA